MQYKKNIIEEKTWSLIFFIVRISKCFIYLGGKMSSHADILKF